jgi:Fe-S cluster assembly iron-binding protein IscA
MLSLTPTAEHHLAQLLATQHAPREQGVRLSANGRGGVAIVVDVPRPHDLVISLRASRLLIVERQVAQALDGKVLDYVAVEVEGHEVGRFTVVHRPA